MREHDARSPRAASVQRLSRLPIRDARATARASTADGEGKMIIWALTQGGDALRLALGYYLSPLWGCFIDALRQRLFSSDGGGILPGKNGTFPTDLYWMVREHEARPPRAGGVPFRTPIDLSLLTSSATIFYEGRRVSDGGGEFAIGLPGAGGVALAELGECGLGRITWGFALPPSRSTPGCHIAGFQPCGAVRRWAQPRKPSGFRWGPFLQIY